MRLIAMGFEPVQEIFDGFFAKKWDVGSAFTAYINGKRVIHLQGGTLDMGKEGSLEYDEDTLQLVASASKVAESLCIALLVDRGLLSYDDRITDHWPEFAPSDSTKAKVTVRQLMMHRAGLPIFDAPLTDLELNDPDTRARFLERQKQVPELFSEELDGTAWASRTPAPPQAYHAISRGLYASELLRRVDPQGRTLGAFFHDEFARPLGLDFWIGLPESEEPRVSPIHSDPRALMKLLKLGSASDYEIDPNDPRFQLFDYEIEFLKELLTVPSSIPARALNCITLNDVPPHLLGMSRQIRACELPSSNGVGTADALAKLAWLIANGGSSDGKKIFRRPESLESALECAHEYAIDGLMKTPIAYSQGGFGRLTAHDSKGTPTYGWGGAGGQMVRFVPELGLGCAYVTNTTGIRMAMHDPRGNALLAATIDCLNRAR